MKNCRTLTFFSSGLTSEKKRTANVNAVGGKGRSVEQWKKKWINIRSRSISAVHEFANHSYFEIGL